MIFLGYYVYFSIQFGFEGKWLNLDNARDLRFKIQPERIYSHQQNIFCWMISQIISLIFETADKYCFIDKSELLTHEFFSFLIQSGRDLRLQAQTPGWQVLKVSGMQFQEIRKHPGG